MFVMLPPAETGLVAENHYDDPRMWGERYHEFGVGAIGTGVAIGDYDGDGRPDVFVVAKTDSCRLFRNLGAWKFEDVTDRAGVADRGDAARVWKQGAAFADVNNDGRLDLYVCRFAEPNLLYINQGDGTFREEAAARGLAVVDASSAAAFCDYDRDGWLDVFVQTNLLDSAAHPNGQRDYLFHNNGDGTFRNVTEHAGISGETQGHSATWWDYDQDGWPDLYVANDFSIPDSLYRNRRDGTFVNVLDEVVPHTPFSSMGGDLGDVNNDGLIDLLVADMAATTHQKDQRGMAPSRVHAREVTSDSTVAPQYERSALYLNTGTGRCLEAAFLAGVAATDWTWSPRFEDLDNDGRLDLHVTNGMNREQNNEDLLRRLMAAETPAERIRIMRASPMLVESNLAFRNRGELRFDNVSAEWGLDHKGVSFGSAFGDLDGDGDLDLVYANYQAGVSVLRNDSDRGNRLIVELRGTRSNRFGIGSLVRVETASGVQVRSLVLLRGYDSTSEPVAHFGLGDDDVVRTLTVDWPSGERQTFTNVPVNRRITLTEPEGSSDMTQLASAKRVVAAPQFSDVSDQAGFTFTSRPGEIDGTDQQPLLTLRQNGRGPALALGDLNGDGIDDAVIGGTARDPARIVPGTRSGRFAADPAELPTAASLDHGPVLIFDADGDGANDLLLTAAGVAQPEGAPEYQPILLLNGGGGAMRAASADALPSLPLCVGAAAAADFDRDGRLDVFLGGRVVPGLYPLPARTALLAHRGPAPAGFVDVTDTVAPGLREIGLVTSCLWTDVDNDGWLDLLVALEWGGIHYWRNVDGRRFEDQSAAAGFAAAGSGWWSSLAAADFNGDGRMDYVAGNLGLNTPYRASADAPAALFLGDFAGDGESRIIEGEYEGGQLFPRRTRRELAAIMPEILKRFPRNDLYARATLVEIVGEERLAAARRFEATEFRSGVLLSRPDGTYEFSPLPRLAQIAPLQGVIAGDFDGDGFADIYAVQNSHAPVPFVGRFDGGLSQLLRGDGRGHFTAVPIRESGLVVRGDAKALALTDLDADGWPDYLITRNGAGTIAFRNAGVAGRRSLCVKLRGPRGNPTPIGARVTLELADGTQQTAEVTAGGGYASQSSAGCFFGYSAANPSSVLRVRWPSGRVSEHRDLGSGPVVTVAAP
nr:FG-GAP-like repeat-containing protein [Opitutus terrae]